MAAENFNSFEYALKNVYSRDYIEDATYPDQPFYSLLEQNIEMQEGGRRWIQPIGWDLPQGRSHTWAKAKANATGQKGSAFEFDYFDDFAVYLIDRKTILRSQGAGSKAFFEAEVDGIDKTMKNLVRSFCVDLFRSGSGQRGRVGAINAGARQVTLSTTGAAGGGTSDVTNFSVGQTITAAVAETTGVERGAPDVMVIEAIDEDAGILTFAAAPGLIAGLLVGDWLFVEGDRNLAMPGLAAWIPDTAPTVATPAFGGVLRHQSVVRLAGSRLNAKNFTVIEGVRRLATKIDRAGGMSDLLVLPPVMYEQLILEVASRGVSEYEKMETQKPTILLEALRIQGPKKKINVISDFNCPENRGYLLRKDDWFVAALGRKLPDMWDINGDFMFWDVGSPGYEVRMDYYAVPICKDPRNQGVLKFDVA